MHYRSLGATGLTVSVLGLGSSPFRFGSLADCATLLEQALELGVTYFDTARSYVNGEDAVGRLTPELRKRLVVATKTGARGGKQCLNDLATSLRTIQRDWIDVWMAHMIQSESEYEMCTDLGGFCDVAAAARQAGLVRATGASFHAPTAVILRAIEERAFDVVMFQLNVIGRETLFGSSIAAYREQLLPAAQEQGIGVVVMKVLAGGELKHGAPRLEFIANAAAGRDTIGGSIRYVTLHPAIGVAVVGVSSTQELVLDVTAVEGVGDGDLNEFADWTQRAANIGRSACTRCGVCLEVCPVNIEIPKVFRLFDQERLFGMDGLARYKYALLPATAAVCNHCHRCVHVCPEGIDVEEWLLAAHQGLS